MEEKNYNNPLADKDLETVAGGEDLYPTEYGETMYLVKDIYGETSPTARLRPGKGKNRDMIKKIPIE